jgi:class 3 adenylate cyclase
MPLTKAQLLELHPLPPELANGKLIERLWIFDLPGKPAELWPFISDTSRMNRALGTSEMTFVEKAGKRYGSSKAGGVRHEWLEVPWNWVAEQWLTSTRIYERGFMKVMYAIHRLEPTDTGTRVYLYFGCIPRGAFGSACIRIGFPTLERAYRRVLPALAAQLDRLRPEVLQLPPPALSEEADARLRAAAEQLRGEGLPPACIDALVDFIRTGDDADLHRIQIRERARTWKLGEEDLLRTALHATRAGIMDLSWDTICPHCRGLREETGTLAEVTAGTHCEVCELDFTTDRVEAIEVTFRVHPSIRDVPERLYCSAEPATRDHVRVQTVVPPGETVTLKPRLAPGHYNRFVDHEEDGSLDIDTDGPLEIVWKNSKDQPSQLMIERGTWSDDALRPGHLLSFQEFRDLFSEDYIGADVKLAVGEQTILFTDVVGSTAFYAERGDPGAFVEIKKHFDEVFAIVRKQRGAVVKTIGDAVMATFGHPLDALRCARAIHDAFHPTREDTPIRLRISINTGPCIAVRLNANADFFGGTVNIAAKLQALAEGHQIAMSEVTYRAPGVAEYLAEQHAKLEELTYESKALREPVSVRRWTVYP